MSLIVPLSAKKSENLPEQNARKSQCDEIQQPEIQQHQPGIFVLPQKKRQRDENQHGQGIGFRHIKKLGDTRAHAPRTVQVEGLEGHPPYGDDRHQQQQIDPEIGNALGNRFDDF